MHIYPPNPARLLFGLLLIVSSCGQKKPEDTVQFLDLEEDDDKLALFKTAVLTCDTESPKKAPCSESVAFLTYIIKDDWGYEDTGIGSCTGFYLGSNIMMTNSHCIPDHLKYDDSTCGEDLQATFLNGEQIFCEKIIKFSEQNDNGSISLDYAFFELKSAPSVKALSLTSEGIRENDKLLVQSVNPYLSHDILEGSLVPRDCKAVTDTVWIPSYSKSNSKRHKTAIVPTIDCDNRGGNSGSPVLGKDGHVHGLLHSIIVIDNIINLILNQLIGESPEVLKTLSFNTNFACFESLSTDNIKNDEFKYATSSLCPAPHLLPKTSDFFNNLSSSLDTPLLKATEVLHKNTALTALNEWIANPETSELEFSKIITLQTKEDTSFSNKTIHLLDEKCFADRDYIATKYKTINEDPNDTTETYESNVIIKAYNMPKFEILSGIDENHRANYKLRSSKINLSYSLSPIELMANKYTWITKSLMSGTGRVSNLQKRLEFCNTAN